MMQQQQHRTKIIGKKYMDNSIVLKKKLQSTWQQIRQNKEKQQQLLVQKQKEQQQQRIVQKQRQSSVQRTRHRKTLTESTLLCSITRMVDCCDFDGSFSSSTNSSNNEGGGGGGAFAEFIFDGDSEDELDDELETSYWEGCQGS